MLIVSLILCAQGCKTLTPNNAKQDDGIPIWWGTRQECIDFLSSPQAKAIRWKVEAIY